MKSKTFLTLATLLHNLWAGPLVAQQIYDFNPKVGGPGDQITVTGSGFSQGMQVVFWQNQPASTLYGPAQNQLTATVPNNLTVGTSGPLRVNNGPYTTNDFLAVGSGPYITAFSPGLGAVGDLIKITGVHFGSTPGVKFGGITATATSLSTISDGEQQISVYVPLGATNAPITVTSSFGTVTTSNSFLVIGPAPYIASFTPAVGGAGTAVTLTGRFFTNVTSVAFSGAPGFLPTITADGQMTVNAPAGVVSGPISITNPKGTTTTTNYFFVPPVVTGLSTPSGRTGTNVTISGSNFLGTFAVRFNGLDAAFTVVNNTTIQATVPAGASSGLVRVIAPAGSAFSSSNFLVPPAIYGFSPVSGGVGTSVTLTGANFDDSGLQVRFNGVQATTVSSVSFGQLTAVVPAGATTGPISVTNVNGGFATSTNFFLPASITSFTPAYGGPGTNVTISGQNFLGATLVTFNGLATTNFTVTNNTTLSVRVPPGVTTGPLSVSTPAGLAVSGTKFYGPPLITGFAPTHGLPGDAVTLYGTNFTDASGVKFNGTSAAFTLTDNFTLQTTVPNGAQTGPLTVVTPGGTSLSLSNFVLDYSSDLSVTAVASPDPVTVGSNLVYTITVWNNGPQDAPNVWLTNTLPSSVVLRSTYATALGSSIFTNNAPPNPVVAYLGTLPAYNPTYVRLTVTTKTAGNIENVTTVRSDYTDPQLSNNSFTLRSYVQPLPLLTIQLISPTQYTVSWPFGLFGFSLQYKSALPAGASWLAATNIPLVTNGQYVITDSVSDNTRFYRLRK